MGSTRPRIVLPVHPQLQAALRAANAAPREKGGYTDNDWRAASGAWKAWLAVAGNELRDGLVGFLIGSRQAFPKDRQRKSCPF